ncbi:MAG: D-2-hydroxyacid dehydrogenase [Kiritimatiellae bacterium]|nr:D-2-hydroxyacid dehydrogenase [Kiritimatiellia bacterium]
MIAIFLQSQIKCFQPTDGQVAVFGQRLKDAAAKIGSSHPAPAIRLCRSEEEFVAALPETSVAIVWTFRQEWFALAPHLKAVYTPAAGRDYFKVSPPPGVTLNYGAFHGAIMGETALACILSMAHGILPYAGMMNYLDDTPPKDPWPRLQIESSARRISSSTILILGFGAIGRTFARMAAPFGPRLIGVTRHPHPELAKEFPNIVLASLDDLDAHLPTADHVVCFLPSGADTDDLIDARRLALMKPSAILYNFGRGNCIEENALAAALHSRRLAGAVLDVFKEEPLPNSSPLRAAPNCWLFPHSSAFSPDYLDLYFASIVPTLI